MDPADPTFVKIVCWTFAVVAVIGLALVIWATNETPANRRARFERYERQDWVSAQFRRQQKADAAYRQNALDKIDASRRSRATKAA